MPTFTSANKVIHFSDTNLAKKPILFLHGLGSRGIDWQPQINAFKNHYRVITLDFPGHGQSDPGHKAFSMKLLAEIVRDLLEHLNIPSAQIVGFKQAYAKRMENVGVCVIPNSRHASPLDSPEFCNREILNFLRGIS